MSVMINSGPVSFLVMNSIGDLHVKLYIKPTEFSYLI